MHIIQWLVTSMMFHLPVGHLYVYFREIVQLGLMSILMDH